MLKIKNLTVNIKDNTVLSKINLEVKKGEIHAILGPKQSGKSSLVHTILGNPIIDIKEGSLSFKRKPIDNLTIDARGLKGIFTGFQFLPVLDGISNFDLAKETLKARGDKRNIAEIEKEYKNLLKKLRLSSNHGHKWVNDETVSNTECKKNEILQMCLIDPDLIILDEIDHDVEEDELELISSQIKEFLKKKDKAAIIVTQNKEFLDLIKPTHVSVIVKGTIKATGSSELYKRLVNDDYSQFSQS